MMIDVSVYVDANVDISESGTVDVSSPVSANAESLVTNITNHILN